MDAAIHIEPYSSAWPLAFVEERDRLREVPASVQLRLDFQSLMRDVRRHMNQQRKRYGAMAPLVSLVVMLAIVFPAFAGQAPEAATNMLAGACQYDKAPLLALGFQAFDQTPEQGWRKLTGGDKCLVEAADLIRDWRTANNSPHPMLYWHEGQLRALHGSVEEAVSLMELSRPEEGGIAGWNHYVDATIAFLRKDRPAFEKARAALAAMPQPPYLDVVDRLGRCFAKAYIQSYRTCDN
jgi:hypothetical protein